MSRRCHIDPALRVTDRGALRELESRCDCIRQPVNPAVHGRWNGMWTPDLIMTVMDMVEDGMSPREMAEVTRSMGGPGDVRSIGFLQGRLSRGYLGCCGDCSGCRGRGGGRGGGWGDDDDGGGGGGRRRRRRRRGGGGGGIPIPIDPERSGRSRTHGYGGPSDSPFGSGMPGMPGMPTGRGMPSGRHHGPGLALPQGMPQGMPGMPGMPGRSRHPMDPLGLPAARSHRSGLPGMPPGMTGIPGMPGMPGRSRMPQGMPSHRNGPPPPFDGHYSRRGDGHGHQPRRVNSALDFFRSYTDDSDEDDIFGSPGGRMGSGMPQDMPFDMDPGMGPRRRQGQDPRGRWSPGAVEVEEVGDDEGGEPNISDADK